MDAEQLRVALDRVVNTLTSSGVLTAIRDYRTAKGDQIPVAAARLGHAGALLMEGFTQVTPAENSTLQLLHLHNVREPAYWNGLMDTQSADQARTAELVHLYSRVLFATNHLPNFAALIARVDTVGAAPGGFPASGAANLQFGESRITVRLTDAGERAADPDRIARSIDGIDMLYSACASLSRRPAMDLRLDHIIGTDDRSIVFTGESDSVSAMGTVIDSIPETLAGLNDDQEINLDELVSSLPIFEQLATLAGRGAFSENDLKDIRETMHQGALLTLESGVVMPEPPVSGAQHPANPAGAAANHNGAAAYGAQTQQPTTQNAYTTQQNPQLQPGSQTGAQANGQLPHGQQSAERDEHYERYLAERAAMQGNGGNSAITSAPDDTLPMRGNTVNADSVPDATSQSGSPSAFDGLLKSLKNKRDG